MQPREGGGGGNGQDESFVRNVSLINARKFKTNGRRCAPEFLCTPCWPTICTIVAGRAEQASAVQGGLADQYNLPHSAVVV